MRVIFLGTSAGRPTKTRNVTSVALVLPEHANTFWLFDAGEGTQHRLLETKLKLNKLERIFITHLHGDHLYGLPGLLSSRTYFEGADKLQLFGPAGIREYIETVMKLSGAHPAYEIEIHEVSPGLVYEDHWFTVEAEELEHRMPCFGYRITEKPRPGQLDLDKLKALGVPSGPLYGKLKLGEDVVLPDGTAVRSADVVGPSIPGRIVAILGDTCPCDNAVRLGKQADLLVHEATFATGMEEKAADYGHSTVKQAAQIAAQAGARKLAVTHFSSRFDAEEVAEMIGGVRAVFSNIIAAEDYLELLVDRV